MSEEDRMVVIVDKYLSLHTKGGQPFRALIEYEAAILEAMADNPKTLLTVKDVDGEYTFVRAEDIEIVFVSTLKGRARLDLFSEVLNREGPNEWEG